MNNKLDSLISTDMREKLSKLLDSTPVYSHVTKSRDEDYKLADKLVDSVLTRSIEWHKKLASMVENEDTTLRALRDHIKAAPSYKFEPRDNYTKYLAAKRIIGNGYMIKYAQWYRSLEDLVGIKRK